MERSGVSGGIFHRDTEPRTERSGVSGSERVQKTKDFTTISRENPAFWTHSENSSADRSSFTAFGPKAAESSLLYSVVGSVLVSAALKLGSIRGRRRAGRLFVAELRQPRQPLRSSSSLATIAFPRRVGAGCEPHGSGGRAKAARCGKEFADGCVAASVLLRGRLAGVRGDNAMPSQQVLPQWPPNLEQRPIRLRWTAVPLAAESPAGPATCQSRERTATTARPTRRMRSDPW